MAWNYNITMQDAGFRQIFQYLGRRAGDLGPALDACGEALMTSTSMRFERQVDPDGNPWAPLAEATIREKAKKGHELTLQRSGRLRNSITCMVIGNTLRIGTNLVYAAIHQFGGDIERHAHSAPIYRMVKDIMAARKAEVWGKGAPFVKRSKADFETWHEVKDYVIHIPARPYLGISLADRAAAIRIFRTHLLEGAA